MKKEYLTAVEQRIKNKRINKQILMELDSHISDKIDYYTELGYSAEEAEKRAVEEMGEPDDTALPLRALHSKKQTTVLMVLTFLYILLVFAAEYFITAMRYSSGLTLILNNRTGTPHNIWMDFLSFAIVSGFVVLLIIAYRQKSISVPIIIAVSLILMFSGEFFIYRLIDVLQVLFPNDYEGMGYMLLYTPFKDGVIEFVPCAVFQPFLYAVFKIITTGFGGYTDSIFSLGYSDLNLKLMCFNGAVIICLALVCWSIFQLVLVASQTLMKRTKTGNKIMSVFIRVIAALLAVYLIIMVTCTGIAALNRKDDKTNAINEKRSMIEEVIFCNPSELTKEDLLANGYKEYSPGEEDKLDALIFGSTTEYYYKNDTNNMITIEPPASDFYMVTFTSTQGNEPVSEEDYDKILTDEEIKTLGDFLKLGFYDRAASVQHTQSTTTYGENIPIDFIEITFKTEDNKELLCSFKAEYKTMNDRPDATEYTFDSVVPMGGYDYGDWGMY